MISGYSIHLYCDAPTSGDQYEQYHYGERQPAIFAGKDRGACIKHARRWGRGQRPPPPLRLACLA
jgi:hypothetical protein